MLPDDREELLSWIAEYYAHDRIPFDDEAVRRGLQELLATSLLGEAYFLEVERQIAGYCLFTFGCDLEVGGRLALLTDLFVRPEFRRKGFGLAALRFIEQRCLQLEIGELQLQVERTNTAAQALYRSFGFRAFDRIPMTKRLGLNDIFK